MSNGDGGMNCTAVSVIDYGQYSSWNGGVCYRCGIHYVGSHLCSYWPVVPTVVTYVPSVVDPRVDELLSEVKKLRRDLKRARKDKSDA